MYEIDLLYLSRQGTKKTAVFKDQVHRFFIVYWYAERFGKNLVAEYQSEP